MTQKNKKVTPSLLGNMLAGQPKTPVQGSNKSKWRRRDTIRADQDFLYFF